MADPPGGQRALSHLVEGASMSAEVHGRTGFAKRVADPTGPPGAASGHSHGHDRFSNVLHGGDLLEGPLG